MPVKAITHMLEGLLRIAFVCEPDCTSSKTVNIKMQTPATQETQQLACIKTLFGCNHRRCLCTCLVKSKLWVSPSVSIHLLLHPPMLEAASAPVHFTKTSIPAKVQHTLTLNSLATVEHPPGVHEDSLLLSEGFTDEMMEMYSPTRQKPSSDSKPVVSQANRSFPVKFLNIMDPLLPSNNLGRSVNKASFARIRKALAHGAQTLTSIVGKV